MTQSLYERLGATPGVTSLAGDLVDAHLANPLIQKRFANCDVPAINRAAATFFTAGIGGPNDYVGKDMVAAHKGMNISVGNFSSRRGAISYQWIENADFHATISALWPGPEYLS